MASQDPWILIPQWFLDKWPNMTGVTTEKGVAFPLLTKSEQKFYQSFADYELFTDIQKLIPENWNDEHSLMLVLMHECGGITKLEISRKRIVGLEPTHWKKVEAVEHDYCYGCSDYDHADDVEFPLGHNPSPGHNTPFNELEGKTMNEHILESIEALDSYKKPEDNELPK
jgi:hypothetical protein